MILSHFSLSRGSVTNKPLEILILNFDLRIRLQSFNILRLEEIYLFVIDI